MDSKRKEELERKRQKLAELRKAREQRSSSNASANPIAASNSRTSHGMGKGSSSGEKLDDLVNSLIGEPNSSFAKSSAAATNTAESNERNEINLDNNENSESNFKHQQQQQRKKVLSISLIPAINIKPSELITYSKECQTTESGILVQSDDGNEDGEDSEVGFDDSNFKFTKKEDEKESHLPLPKPLAMDPIDPNPKKVQLKDLSDDEKKSIENSDFFVNFIDKSVKIMERAMKMTETYDYLIDYTEDYTEFNDDKSRIDGLLTPLVTFDPSSIGYASNKNFCRSISSLDWNAKFPELLLASYGNVKGMGISSVGGNSNSSDVGNEGLVLVWNTQISNRPEFTFLSQSEVLSAIFNPFQPQLIIGGTFAGQVVLWDTRAPGKYPCQKTPLSVGHTHPIYSMEVIGSANAHSVLTISTDGLACTWQVDRLGQPTSMLELTFPTHLRTDEVAVTSLAFPNNIYGESDLFFVGTEEGKIYQGSRVDRAGVKAGLFPYDTYKGHCAPVTSISFHPVSRMGTIERGSTGIEGMKSNSTVVNNNDFSIADSELSLSITANQSSIQSNSQTSKEHQQQNSIYSGPSKLFLSSGMDWTIRVWKAKSLNKPSIVPTVIEPIVTLEGSTDSVISDACWHPIRPNILGSVNGAGLFEIWDLNEDHQVPVVTYSPGPKALTRLAWDREEKGSRVALGSTDGIVNVMQLSTDLTTMGPNDSDYLKLNEMLLLAQKKSFGMK